MYENFTTLTYKKMTQLVKSATASQMQLLNDSILHQCGLNVCTLLTQYNNNIMVLTSTGA